MKITSNHIIKVFTLFKSLFSELTKKNLLFGLAFFISSTGIFAFISITKYISYFKVNHAKYYKPCNTCVDLNTYLDRVFSDFAVPEIQKYIIVCCLAACSLFIIYLGFLVLIKIISSFLSVSDNKTICKIIACLFFLVLSAIIIYMYFEASRYYFAHADAINPLRKFDIPKFYLSFFIVNGWLSTRLYNLLSLEK